MKRVAVVGAGSWGTAVACLLAGNVPSVALWARHDSLAEEMNATRENRPYLPGVALPPAIVASSRLADVAAAEAVFVAVPSKAFRAVAGELAALPLAPAAPVVSCAKGIESHTGLRMSEVLHEVLPGRSVAVLSGPNHAEEIGRGQPAAAVIACQEQSVALALQATLAGPAFRAYTSADVTGVEWGGAVKNIFAIAGGICDGLGLGDNAKAALVTRGLAEMIRLGTVMGGQPQTFQGLSGVGDLVVTCYSRHSRNNRVGHALGQGEKLADVMARMTMVAEGVPNTESIHEAARAKGVRTPIIDTIYDILYRDVPAREGLRALLSRDPRAESD